jgi:two-component system nitrate/nitrite response regulator NarL
MNGTELTSVLVVEDHPLFRSALIETLRRRPEIQLAGEASDGEEALAKIRELRPDVALVDLRMPRVGGLDVLKTVVNERLSTRVVILSADVDEAVREAVEREGAAGCLAKSADGADIADALVAARVGRTLPDQRLTERELEILRLVAEGHSPPGIARRLYLSRATVGMHLKHVYQKLGVPDRAAAVAKAMRVGLLR